MLGFDKSGLVFDSNLAFNHIEDQVSFGPRYPGSFGHKKTIELIQNTLIGNGWTVDTQEINYLGFILGFQ